MSAASVVCPACGIVARITNRGEIGRHGGTRIIGRREVACLLSGSSATATPEQLADELELHASTMLELAATPGTTPKETAFYRAAAGSSRLVAVRLRRGILPRSCERAPRGL